MSKVAVVYWSGTGNTEAMAKAIADGVKEAGAEEALLEVSNFSAERIADYDGVIFGCPAMGAEELEEDSFEPMWKEAEGKIKDVPVALFGSYGWGGGEWMKTWEERAKTAGAKLFGDGLIIENTPDDNGLADCKKFGNDFAKSI
ncbi:MAG: flavodoxin [Selenomonadaceae bacterium]|nr:flavodoxin [Selenomonadaceae bacterium]